MSKPHFALFGTDIGSCAIAWGPGGIVGTQLPLPDAIDLSGRMTRRFPDATEAAPPADIGRAIEAMIALLAGEKRDLSSIALDMRDVEPFHQQVYAIARRIAAGETTSYGAIATELGDLALSRDVGQALGLNPFPIIVPCHRVLGSNGKLGGFSANGGVETKIKMLNIEQAGAAGGGLFGNLPFAARPRS